MQTFSRTIIIIGLLVCVALLGVSQDHRYRPTQFENESRAAWQKVDEVIQAMNLNPGDTIADIGGGSGYFSRPFAKTVGQNGVVYCCELATNLMEYLQEKAKEENLNNIVTVYAAPDRPMLPPESLDHIFICNTNHHLKNRVEYHKNLIPLLKKGGQLVIVDWKKKRQKVGPPPGHNLAKETAIQEMKQAGWTLKKEVKDVLEYQYFLIFTKD